jgi:uncharacterized repeat protein (TIGR03803 family)
MVSARAQGVTIKQLFGFACDPVTNSCPNGQFPGELIEGGDGNFYGFAFAGGVGKNSQGTIFKITPTGQFSTIYSFAENPDGSLPFGAAPTSLVEGTDGFLYGTTLVDGANGLGTVFKLSKAGVIMDLHDFCATLQCSDGSNPSFLMQASDGNFYGATGPNNPPTSVIFRITPTEDFTVLHTFVLKKDGTGVFGMLQAPDGNFYGTTVAGSEIQGQVFNSVFRMSPAGTYKILHSFDFSHAATSAPILASNGQLMGLQNNSILYQISLKGVYKQLGPLSSRQFFDGDLLEASDGNLWGDFFGGIAFESTLTGSVLLNKSFNSKVNGDEPETILQAANGKFYGTTFVGGAPVNGQPSSGTIWSIDGGLPAPLPDLVGFAPATGGVGSTVLIQGSHFTGTTSVTFNGVSAAFHVLSAHYLSAAVPAGATSGPMTITNAGGSASPTKNFTVH